MKNPPPSVTMPMPAPVTSEAAKAMAAQAQGCMPWPKIDSRLIAGARSLTTDARGKGQLEEMRMGCFLSRGSRDAWLRNRTKWYVMSRGPDTDQARTARSCPPSRVPGKGPFPWHGHLAHPARGRRYSAVSAGTPAEPEERSDLFFVAGRSLRSFISSAARPTSRRTGTTGKMPVPLESPLLPPLPLHHSHAVHDR